MEIDRKEKIILYNHFHNGDIFYSRVLINILSEKFEIDFYHNLSRNLFSDMDINEFTKIPDNFDIHNTNFNSNIINTWIGQRGMIFVGTQNPGCSFDNYMILAREIASFYNIKLKNTDLYLPSIKYDRLDSYQRIKNDLEYLIKDYDKVLLISNGDTNSGQSINFSFNNIIDKLASENSNTLFLITHNFMTNNKNIIHTYLITQQEIDLLENSLISRYCNIIVGRASGPFCFTHVKENLLDINKTFISFTHNINEGTWYSGYKCNQIWSNNYSEDNIIEIIKKEIIK